MIKKLYKGIRLFLSNCLILLFWLCPIKRKIFVTSYYGKGYGDSPKYIIDEILKKYPNVKIVWSIKKDVDTTIFPKSIKVCRNDSLTMLFHLATAKIWIDNCRKFPVLKRKKQLYIQTWHGFALKRIEKDVASHLGKYYVRFAKADSKMIDLIVSDSKFMTEIYQKAFWYNGKIAEWGSPRNDIIVNEDNVALLKVYNFYNIEPNKKIILYAPTFRADNSIEAYSIDYNRLRASCKKKFGDDFVILVRLHPNIMEKCKELTFIEGEIINATYYPDMQELLMASSICITDYSSLMFDFALSKKPCFQFATDIEDYKKDRNFYFEIDSLPFPLSKNNDELEQSILAFNIEEYQKGLEAFFESVGMIRDGKASGLCAEWIVKKIS